VIDAVVEATAPGQLGQEPLAERVVLELADWVNCIDAAQWWAPFLRQQAGRWDSSLLLQPASALAGTAERVGPKLRTNVSRMERRRCIRFNRT